MKKFFKNVIEVLPNLSRKGRFFICDGTDIISGSKEFVFGYLGCSVVAVQLMIPFDLFA